MSTIERSAAAVIVICALAVILGSLFGCAGVSSIQHPMIIADKTCEFDEARPGIWPWDVQMCLTTCVDGKTTERFAGCSSEGGMLAGIKDATGLMPTLPLPVY